MALMRLDDDGATWFPCTVAVTCSPARLPKPQCSHNDFMVKETVPPDYVALITGSEGPFLYFCPLSQTFVLQDSKVCAALCKILRMHKIHIPLNARFFGDGYRQHTGPAWDGKHCLTHPLYFISETYFLGDTVYFTYGNSRGLRRVHENVEGKADSYRWKIALNDILDEYENGVVSFKVNFRCLYPILYATPCFISS